jgi:UDP-N-acetylmuramoyl-tripeptide--D-alanyl-D-alanine ligase
LHRECGAYAKGRADLVIGVRGLAKHIVEAAQQEGVEACFVDTPEQAGEILSEELREGDAVLMKASRGVKLERALETLRTKLTK